MKKEDYSVFFNSRDDKINVVLLLLVSFIIFATIFIKGLIFNIVKIYKAKNRQKLKKTCYYPFSRGLNLNENSYTYAYVQ